MFTVYFKFLLQEICHYDPVQKTISMTFVADGAAQKVFKTLAVKTDAILASPFGFRLEVLNPWLIVCQYSSETLIILSFLEGQQGSVYEGIYFISCVT
jgi:hypothetical protein